MKQLTILLLLLNFFLSYSQESKLIRKLDPFKEVKGFDGLSINLIPSNENKAVITGDDSASVAIVNNNGVLKIRMKILKIFSGYKTFIDLYYAQKLAVVDVNEDSRITTEGIIKQDVLELKAQEGGELVVNAEVEQMLIKSVTGGVIKTTGASKVQDIQINTGGVYEGKGFITGFTTINVNAGSRAEIYASDYVKAMVKAGGEVLIYGDPDKIDEKTVFGGIIKKM